VSVRFFSPRTTGANTITFMLGTYVRGAGGAADPGTMGVVYEVVARRDTSGWRVVSANPKYVS
jgi:hypothetical protein